MNIYTFPRNILFLSFAFFFIFAGYNGAQQYVTTFLSTADVANAGFYSLIIVYLSFTISDPFSSIIVSKYGAKKAMMLAVIFYVFFILSLPLKILSIIYLASFLLGVAASLLWTGQNSYLVRASKDTERGQNAGFFGMIFSLGSALGLIFASFFLTYFSYTVMFVGLGLFSALAFLFLFRLEDIRNEEVSNHLLLLKKALLSKTAWQLSVLWFCVFFVYGIGFGIVPLQTEQILGTQYIGVMASLFFILPILLSFSMGKISDRIGRKKMIFISFLLMFLGVLLLSFASTSSILVIGILLLAINSGVINPIIQAFVGDVTTKENLEYLTSFFWMIQNVGVVFSLALATALSQEKLYWVLLSIIPICFLILFPLLRKDLSIIKQKINQEMQ